MDLKNILVQLTKLQQYAIDIVETPKKDCTALIDKIEKDKLYTVKKEDFDPGRVRKTEYEKDAKYYVGYLGDKKIENVTAILVVNFNRPDKGFAYINELVGVKRGYGFKTLKKFIYKFKNWKIWLISSPKYDEATNTYLENKKLNAQYRKNMVEMKEFQTYAELGPKAKLNVSWFYTPNCKDRIIEMVKAGNYYGI
jgi:hypothetical protein